MNSYSTRQLGGTFTPGSSLSGTRYISQATRAPHSLCWMELAVFAHFPDVPSLSGTRVQERQDLLASTYGAGSPEMASLFLEIELFDDECPQLCANFRRLCCGQSSTRQGQVYYYQGLTPSYRGTFFHKIIPSYCAQGGDITMRVKQEGTNSYSSAGRTWLPDESKQRRHNKVGLVSMANNGPNSNGSQFFITTSAAHERAFNGRHCCVGQVVRGLDAFMDLVAPYGDLQGYPSKYVVVVDCGEGKAPTTLLETAAADPSASMVEGTQMAREVTAEPAMANTVVPCKAAERPCADASTTSTSNPPPLRSSLKQKTNPASRTQDDTSEKHVAYQL